MNSEEGLTRVRFRRQTPIVFAPEASYGFPLKCGDVTKLAAWNKIVSNQPGRLTSHRGTSGIWPNSKRPERSRIANRVKESNSRDICIAPREKSDRCQNALLFPGNSLASHPGISGTHSNLIASGVFGQLQDALNTIWGVKPKPGGGIWGFLRARFLSFAMVGGVCFLLLVSLTVESVLRGLNTYLENILPGGHFLALAIFFIFDLAVIILLFAMIFRYLPDVKIGWRDVWLGAAIRMAHR
jgi:hypothetical protein